MKPRERLQLQQPLQARLIHERDAVIACRPRPSEQRVRVGGDEQPHLLRDGVPGREAEQELAIIRRLAAMLIDLHNSDLDDAIVLGGRETGGLEVGDNEAGSRHVGAPTGPVPVSKLCFRWRPSNTGLGSPRMEINRQLTETLRWPLLGAAAADGRYLALG